MPLDVAKVREDFPTLKQTVGGHPLVYLDSAATSLKPQVVIDTERKFYEEQNSAVHRGAHTLAANATELFENARATVAQFVGANANEIVWTSNTTAAINLVCYSISNATAGRGGAEAERFRLNPGDEIVVTEMEHHANLVPWQELALRTGASLRFLPIDDFGAIRMDEAATIIGPRTKVLAFTHVSNVLGTINPVAELTRLAHNVGALVVLDAAQSAPQFSLNLHDLGVDFAAFSGHKMLGPLGIGVLYGKSALLNALPPFLTGGSMITEVTMTRSEYLPAPARFEAGTPQISQAIALAAASEYLTKLGMDAVHEHEAELGQLLASGVAEIRGVQLLGPRPGEPRAGLAAFTVEGVHPHDVAQFLDNVGIAVRSGHHCAQPLHRRLSIAASTRASVSVYTTADEIDTFLDAMTGVRKYFKL